MRVVIADDELMARQRLERLVRAIPDVQLIAACESGGDVLEVLRNEPVDLLLLDIDMPGLSGLDTGALLGSDGPKVIFVTAHPQHALAAFGVGATDYLLKPIDVPRLQAALDRVRKSFAPRALDDAPIALTSPRGVRLVKPLDITHALFDGTVVEVHVAEGRFLTECSLQELEHRLPEDRFVRIHRRALVNLHHVDLLEPVDSGGYLARLKTGEKVAVSRQAARALRKRFGLARGSAAEGEDEG